MTAVSNVGFQSNLDQKVDSGVPWYSRSVMEQRDNNGDGTAGASKVVPYDNYDDQDHDGTNDFDDWVSGGGNVEDPWLSLDGHYLVLADDQAGTYDLYETQR